jgi:hypothetical protein
MATIDLGRLGFVNKGTYNNSTTYEKNDLVQFTDGGILSTYLYIDSTAQSGQAPSSSGTAGSRWVYYAKGVADSLASAGNNKVIVTNASGQVTPLSIGSASQVLKVNSGANGFEFGADAGGSIRKLTMFNDATYNITTSNASVSFPITFDFVKAQADSDLFIQGWTPVSQDSAYRIGERMRVQKVADSSYDSGSDAEIYGGNHFMSPPGNSSADGVKGKVNWSRRIDTSSETFFNSAETYRVYLGWATRSGSALRAGITWNPQNTSSRDRQSSTVIWVWELDPSNTAFIT